MFACFSLQLHSDQDKGDGSLKYILSGDGAGTLFIIDEKTGDIHATRRIDREEKAFYTLRAQAINRRTLRPVEPESEFVIKIHDINDNEPTFPEEIYTASVPEMSVVGECLDCNRNACSNYVIQEIFSPSSENSVISGVLYGISTVKFGLLIQILEFHPERDVISTKNV